MSETLDDVKRRISSEYLGVGSIHGVGLRRAENAVCVYTHGGGDLVGTPLEAEIKAKAKPYAVIFVEEQAPMITGNGD